MATQRIYGYADPWSIKAGETLSFMVSGEGMEAVDAQLVRLIHGDENPDGPGFVEEEVASAIPARLPVKRQFTQVGAHAVVSDPDQRLAMPGDFTIYAFVYPTKPGVARQAILSKWDIMSGKGYALGISPEGRLEFWVGDGASIDHVAAEVPLVTKVWYFVAVSFNAATREAKLYQIGVINRYNSLTGPVVPFDYGSRVVETLRVAPADPGVATPFHWAGASEENDRRGRFVGMLYCGKIDRAGVAGEVLAPEAIEALARSGDRPAGAVIAHWDTTADYTDSGIGDTIVDVGPQGPQARYRLASLAGRSGRGLSRLPILPISRRPMAAPVFRSARSPGSQALPYRNGDNNVGRIMRNVLDAFLRPGPLPGSEFVGEEKLWR
jgi:N,N-dimethylformamidase